MKGYVQEPETSDFKTEGWGEGGKDVACPPMAGVRGTELTLIILPLPLGEGRGEGLKNNYNLTFPKQRAGVRGHKLFVPTVTKCFYFPTFQRKPAVRETPLRPPLCIIA